MVAEPLLRMSRYEADRTLSTFASYIRCGNTKEAGELATQIMRHLTGNPNPIGADRLAGIAPGATVGLDGLADWLRTQAKHPCAGSTNSEQWSAWAAAVDAARGVEAPMLRDHLRDIDLALAAITDLKPLAEYGVVGTYDTVQARRQKALMQAETALLSLRRDLVAAAGVAAVPAAWHDAWGKPWSVLDALKHAHMLLARRGESDARIDAVLAGSPGVPPSPGGQQ